MAVLLWILTGVSLLTGSRCVAAPTILSASPGNGAIGVAPTTPLVLSFSAPMNKSVTTVQFTDLTDPLTPLITSLSWNASGTQLTCTPSPAFPPGKPIVWSASGKDLQGVSLTGTKDGFFTTGAGGPSIVGVTPQNLAIDVPLNTDLTITFSVPMNVQATFVQLHDSLQPLVALPLVITWSPDHRVAVCDPIAELLPGRTLVWTVVGEDATGQVLSTANGLFMTLEGLPQLEQVDPADGATGVAPTTSVVFRFTRPMNIAQTAASFKDTAGAGTAVPVDATWNGGANQLTCTAPLGFPAEHAIEWTLTGVDQDGNVLTTVVGHFTTGPAGDGTLRFPKSSILISRGERFEQTGAELLERAAYEYLGMGDRILSNGVSVAAPAPGLTGLLQSPGWPSLLEYRSEFASSSEFATRHPAGDYTVTASILDGSASAVIPMRDGLLPSMLKTQPWGIAPYVLKGQPYTVSWSALPGGATVDYVQILLERSNAVAFATPLPGNPGALTGQSNSVIIPASVFAAAGQAEVRLVAFGITAIDTNSLRGVAVRSARHRSTTFPLRIVDGTLPPPLLLSTNLAGIPVGESFVNPLLAKGVRPLRYTWVDGTLPPGLRVEESGSLSGEASAVGNFSGRIRITDLLGRSSTQSVKFGTVPLDPGIVPRLTIQSRDPDGSLRVGIGGRLGEACTLEHSTNLTQWVEIARTNLVEGQAVLRVPMVGHAGFLRVRGASLGIPVPKPLKVAPSLNPNRSVSARLDAVGGALSLTNPAGYVIRLTVPPGALSASETIVMTDVSGIGGLPLSGGMRAAVDLKPDGLMLFTPAQLDITAPAGTGPSTLIAFGSRADGSQFALQPSVRNGTTLSMQIWHFSMAGAGAGSASDSQAQSQNAPEDPMSAMAQEVAAALAACKADPSCSENPTDTLAKLVPVYVRMADLVVLPKLQAAVGDDSVLDEALQVWLKWLKEMAMLGLFEGDLFGSGGSGELANRIRRAGSLAVKALTYAVEKSCQDCMNHRIERIYRMLELARVGALLGLDFDQAFWNCARKCLVFEVSVESEILASGSKATFSTHTKAKAKLRPQTLGQGSDGGSDDIVRLMLIFEGSGTWSITDLQPLAVADCKVMAAPSTGRLEIPWAKISLYQKRQVWIPGQGPVSSYVFQPEMTLDMRAGLETMPKEGRLMVCPKAPPEPVEDIFAPTFNAFHNDEAVIPSGLEESVLGGPVFRMTGFAPGGPEDVILSKPYFRNIGKATENTLIELRHTPGG